MVVLGIDPGTARTGFALVSEDPDGNPVLLRAGVITTPAGEQPPRRLVAIYQQVTALISEFAPETMAIEQLFFRRNVTTAISVAQSRGVILLAAAQADLRVYEYGPAEVKLALSGFGRAEKQQMQEMVRLVLGLDDIPRPDDAADAVAIALCHLQSVRLRSLEGIL